MKKIAMFFAALALVSAASVAQAEEPATKTRVAVLPFEASTGIDAGAAELVTEEVLNRLRQHDNLEIISLDEIDKLISLEQKKQLLGCSDDSCLIEAAGALGVEQLLMCKMGRIGSQYAFSLKLLNVHEAKMEKQAYRRISSNTGEEAFNVLAKMVDELFGATAAETVSTTSATAGKPDAQAEAKKSGGVTPWVWVTGGLAVASLGAGTLFGLLAQGHKSKGEDLVADSHDVNVPYSDVEEHQDAADRNAVFAYIGFGVGGALAVTTLVLALTTGGSGGDAPPVLAPYATPDGGGVAWSTSF